MLVPTSPRSSGYYGGFHIELRSVVAFNVGKYIEKKRSNPELNCPNFCPNFCRVIVLDDEGEWRKNNPVFTTRKFYYR